MKYKTLLCTLALSQGAFAQDGMFDSFGGGDEELLRLATGIDQPISAAPAVATVITKAEIVKMGARSIDDALRSVPGLHIGLSSNRWTPTINIRGIITDSNPQVLLLVNEIPLKYQVLGNRGFYPQIPIHSVERIEIIRGPGSAVYGADAYAGVINVVTKSPDNARSEVGARIGSFETTQAWAVLPYEVGETKLLTTIEYSDADGDDSRVIDFDAQSLFDLFGTNASNAPGAANTMIERLDLRTTLMRDNWSLNAWYWQVDAGTGPGIAQALDPSGTNEERNYLIDWTANYQLNDDWQLQPTVSYMDLEIKTDITLFPAGTVLPIGTDGNVNPLGTPVLFSEGFIGNPDSLETQIRTQLAFVRAGERHTARFAIGWQSLEAEGRETKNFGPGVINGTEGVVNGTLTNVSNTQFVYLPETDRTVSYLSLQDEWKFKTDWALTAGIRFDDYSDFGNTTNPRVALVWSPSYNTHIKALYGRAFRAPSFFELSGANNPAFLGNPELDPEVIDTFEIAADIESGAMHYNISLYFYDIEDQINYIPDQSGTSSTAQNIGKQEGSGIELEFNRDHSAGSFGGNLSFQKAEVDNGDDVANTPQTKIYLYSNWEIDANWHLHLAAEQVMDRKRVSQDPRSELDDYLTFDISLRYSSTQHWDFALTVHNATDDDRLEPSPANLDIPTGSLVPNDYPLSERSLQLEVSYHY